jgi:hypothetical protein
MSRRKAWDSTEDCKKALALLRRRILALREQAGYRALGHENWPDYVAAERLDLIVGIVAADVTPT